jgi:hypothetical protein
MGISRKRKVYLWGKNWTIVGAGDNDLLCIRRLAEYGFGDAEIWPTGAFQMPPIRKRGRHRDR